MPAWAAKEGVPITEDFGVDLLAVPTAPWPRFGVDGGDRESQGPRRLRLDLRARPRAGRARPSPQKHCSRRWSTCCPATASPRSRPADGRKHSFEWGPKSLFALPLNARYQHFNSSGRERARLASTNNLAHDAQPVPQRGTSSSTTPTSSRSGRARAKSFQRRRRIHSGAARPQHVGDEFHSRPRRFRAEGLGASAAPAART